MELYPCRFSEELQRSWKYHHENRKQTACGCPLNVNRALPACWWIISRCVLAKTQRYAGWYWKAVRDGVMGMYSPLWDHWSRLFSFPPCHPVILCLCSSLCHSPLRPSLIYSSVSPIRCASNWLIASTKLYCSFRAAEAYQQQYLQFSFFLSFFIPVFRFWNIIIAGGCLVLCYALMLPWFKQEKLTPGVSSPMLLWVPVILFIT